MVKKFDKNIFYVKNKDFHTIQIKVIFPFYDTLDDLGHISLLSPLVSYMNNDFDTEEKFLKERQRRYILGTGCTKNAIGNNIFFSYSMIIPDEDALGFDILEEQFDFFNKYLYNPKVIDGGFDKFELDREKNDLKKRISNGMKNLGVYQSVKVVDNFDTEGVLSREIHNHLDLIDEVTPSSLYNYYLDKIYNNDPLVFVFGDFDEDKMTNLVNKYIVKDKKKDISYEIDFNHFLPPRDTISIINDDSHFKDSSISLVYKVKNMSEDDFIILSLISSLLSSLSSRLLYKVLRDEYELIYSCKSVSYLRAGALEITAFINKDNKDLVIEKIKEVVNSLKDEEFTKEFLNNIIDRRRLGLIQMLDNKYGLLDEIVCKELGVEDIASVQYELVKKITPNDISKFIDRLVLDTIYFIKEEEHD